MVTRIFQGGELETGQNKTLMTLIPKVAGPKSIKDSHLISLLNVSYKIITKIIANKLKNIMFGLISETQASFVKGMSISDNIIMAQEVIHLMRRKKGNVGWMTIKMDLNKAYNELSWDFTKDTLQDVGFPQDHALH